VDESSTLVLVVAQALLQETTTSLTGLPIDEIYPDRPSKGFRMVSVRHTDQSKTDGVAIVSGGLDSVTLAHHLVNQGQSPHLLSFDYGQRHKKELEYARGVAELLSLPWTLIDLSSLTELISTSALTSNPQRDGFPNDEKHNAIEVPEGHYAEDNMALTVVPNRNMMMLSIATAACVSMKGTYVAAGMHAGDHAQYPDCRVEFIEAYTEAAHWGNQGFIAAHFRVFTPFIEWDKNEIAFEAHRLGVQPADTWSCYKGGDWHCGRCGTCVERLEAIASVGDSDWDKTAYSDTEFWKRAVAEYKENV
jgi:7-cyano-7-deazaguanine synthase